VGLDASVYCDCYETGRLKSQPLPQWKVYVEPNGSRSTGAEDLDLQVAFDGWSNREACEHENGILVHHRIGNIALVSLLRAELKRSSHELHLILNRIVYDGIHSGDFIAVDDVRRLQAELEPLSRIHSSDPSTERFLRNFEHQRNELITSALRVNKPIAF
jgi:hypothetical protein